MFFRSKRQEFLKKIDTAALEAGIREAENATTGEIRVMVLPRIRGSLANAAEHAARRLRMTSTRDRNAVLILVDPTQRRFHIWGDRALHEKVGPEFWKGTAEAISERFRERDFTGGLLHGIRTAGHKLAEHFPCGPGGHVDRLPETAEDQE